MDAARAAAAASAAASCLPTGAGAGTGAGWQYNRRDSKVTLLIVLAAVVCEAMLVCAEKNACKMLFTGLASAGIAFSATAASAVVVVDAVVAAVVDVIVGVVCFVIDCRLSLLLLLLPWSLSALGRRAASRSFTIFCDT